MQLLYNKYKITIDFIFQPDCTTTNTNPMATGYCRLDNITEND